MSQPGEPAEKPRRTLPPGTLRLGTVSGIDILVQQSWFLILVLIAIVMQPRVDQAAPGLGGWSYVAAAAFAVLLYFTVLLHEISHAVAARSFQMPVSSINLHFLGGFTEIEGEAATPWREFVIAVVGPLTSLALGGLGYLAFTAFNDGLAGLIIGALTSANILVGGLNLVPGLPLDGGRVLSSAVWGVSRRRVLGLQVAAWAGRGAAILAACYPLILLYAGYTPQIVDYLFAFMIGAFMWGGATQALLSAAVQERLPRLQARQLARPAIGVPADLPLAEAIRRAQEANAGSLVIVSSGGRPEGIVNEAAVASTPLDRRPWMATGAVARRLEAGLMLAADLQGEDLLRAMQTTPATEYVLVEPSGSVYGVLVTKDVDHAFRRD